MLIPVDLNMLKGYLVGEYPILLYVLGLPEHVLGLPELGYVTVPPHAVCHPFVYTIHLLLGCFMSCLTTTPSVLYITLHSNRSQMVIGEYSSQLSIMIGYSRWSVESIPVNYQL